ncbi:hypothetical protein Pmani_018562 [Petrolisthes manimaculis]|uniref:Endonuclease-reverse transcriptase n=1 Tax=Petrolisthes manimaculis TaxID=1843537 RepID=A0AAE1U892_9EUCA|nr:hypothetical protein Pmani_018562 [Petrolisthes manimaculis]
MKSRIQHSEETITDLVKSLEFTQAEVKELQNEVSVLKTSNNDNKTTIEIMKSQIVELERRTNYQEDYNRRNNLRFTGIQEQPSGESWEETAQIVTKLLEDKLQVPTMKLERAHRTGQANPSRQRTIVARFEKYGDRETVLRNARKLKGTGIYINEDLCQGSQEIRNKQLPLLKEARNQGKIAFFKYTKLIIKKRTTQRPETASNEPTGRVGGDVTVSGGAGGSRRGGSGAGVGGSRDVSSAAPVDAGVWAAAGAAAVSPAVVGVDTVDMSPAGAGAGAAASSLRDSSDGTPTHVGSLGGSAGDLRVGSGVVQRKPMNLRNRKK